LATVKKSFEKILLVGKKSEVLNVKILKIMTKLCIRSDDTKKDRLLTPFSIVNLIEHQ
jgi:hypothetical protein